jgi:hypothetical protein
MKKMTGKMTKEEAKYDITTQLYGELSNKLAMPFKEQIIRQVIDIVDRIDSPETRYLVSTAMPGVTHQVFYVQYAYGTDGVELGWTSERDRADSLTLGLINKLGLEACKRERIGD